MLCNKNKVFWKNIFSYNLLRVKTQGQESLGMPAAWKLYLDVAVLWADMLIWKTCKRTLVIQLSRIIFKFGTRWESIYLQKKRFVSSIRWYHILSRLFSLTRKYVVVVVVVLNYFLMQELTTISTAEMLFFFLFFFKQMNIFHSLDPLNYLPYHDKWQRFV